MAGGKILSVRLDDLLEAQLETFAAANNLSRSAAARELLRQVLTSAESVTRGWQEGRLEAVAAVYSAVGEAVRDLTREA